MKMEKEKTGTYKFLSNVSTLVTFEFDTGLKKEGDYGDYWTYGVMIGGKKYYINANKHLAEDLKAFEPLKGKSLLILKQTTVVNGKEKAAWLVSEEDGQDIIEQAEQSRQRGEEIRKEIPKVDKKPNTPEEIMLSCIMFTKNAFEKYKVPDGQIGQVINCLFLEKTRNGRG